MNYIGVLFDTFENILGYLIDTLFFKYYLMLFIVMGCVYVLARFIYDN